MITNPEFFGTQDYIYVIGLPFGYFWPPCVYNFTPTLCPNIVQMPRFIHIHEITHIRIQIEWPKISTRPNGKSYPERFIHTHTHN